MENWRKFGNPDGKQPMEVSIALPTFLLEKEHHNTILIIYLIAMVVIIPCEPSHPIFSKSTITAGCQIDWCRRTKGSVCTWLTFALRPVLLNWRLSVAAMSPGYVPYSTNITTLYLV